MNLHKAPLIEDPAALNLLRSFGEFRRVAWQRNNAIEDLTPAEIMILFHLRGAQGPNCNGIKVSELSSHLRVAKPTATQHVNSLVKNGFVEKRAGEKDRREVRLVLTEKGEAATHKSWAALSDAFRGLVEFLGEEDSDRLAELLTRAFTYLNSRSVEATQEVAGLEE